MSTEDIIYKELNYVYCDNCRYDSEIGDEDPEYGCDDCHRKYSGWGISMNTAKRIARLIENERS